MTLHHVWQDARQLSLQLRSITKVVDAVTCNPYCFYEYWVALRELYQRNGYTIDDNLIKSMWIRLGLVT